MQSSGVTKLFQKGRIWSIILIVLLLCIVVFSISCSKKSDAKNDSAASADETLDIMAHEEPPFLVMQYGMPNMATAYMVNSLFDTLVRMDLDTKKVVPNVAESWEWIDGTHLKMKLRDDVIAYDGTKITANDVYYSFKVGVEGKNFNFPRIFNIDEFTVEDEFTIILGLRKVYPTLLDVLCNTTYSILSESSVEAEGGFEKAIYSPKINSGKYNFVEWVPGQYVLMERNENYWNKDAMPEFKYQKWTFTGDAASRAMALESGETDIVTNMTVPIVKELEDNQKTRADIQVIDSSKGFWMNCSEGPLSDLRVRKAVFLLLDSKALSHLATGGYGTITDTQFSPANPYYSPPKVKTDRKVDVETAKKLLAEAGYSDGFKIEMLLLAMDIPLGELMQANLAEAGIELFLDIVEGMAFVTKMNNGDYDSYLGEAYGWDIARMIFKVDGRVPVNLAGGGAQYNNDELNKRIDIASTAIDFDERKAAYEYIQDVCRDEMLVIGLYTGICINGMKNSLGNLELDVNGYPDFTSVRTLSK